MPSADAVLAHGGPSSGMKATCAKVDPQLCSRHTPCAVRRPKRSPPIEENKEMEQVPLDPPRSSLTQIRALYEPSSAGNRQVKNHRK